MTYVKLLELHPEDAYYEHDYLIGRVFETEDSLEFPTAHPGYYFFVGHYVGEWDETIDFYWGEDIPSMRVFTFAFAKVEEVSNPTLI